MQKGKFPQMETFFLRFISFLVLGTWIVLVTAQESKIDSLKNLLHEVENEDKVDVLIELSFQSFPDDLENQRKYANQALEIAQTINYLKGKGKALYSLSWYYMSTSDYTNAEKKIKDAIEINLLHGDSIDISNSYRVYGYISIDISNFGDALNYFKKSIFYLHKDSLWHRHDLLESIGIAQFNLTNYKANFILKEKNQEIQNQNEEITVQAEELSVAYTKLKELDEFKQGLTNMIVHDLKNPLNIILNLSEEQLVKEAGNKMLNIDY